MRALVISDTHFGAWTGRDILREEFALERLAPHLDEVGELIFLGDLFDFLFGSVARAGEAAAGWFSPPETTPTISSTATRRTGSRRRSPAGRRRRTAAPRVPPTSSPFS